MPVSNSPNPLGLDPGNSGHIILTAGLWGNALGGGVRYGDLYSDTEG